MVNPREGTENIHVTETPEIVPFDFGGDSVNEGESAMILCAMGTLAISFQRGFFRKR